MTKLCKNCGIEKPTAEFYRDKQKSDGLTVRCRACIDAQHRAYRERDPDVYAARQRMRSRRFQRKTIQKVTDAELAALIVKSGGRCGICRTPVCDDSDDHKGRLVVDHDHETGRVRGILCDPCNTGLGRFRDDPARLLAAASYLREGGSNQG